MCFGDMACFTQRDMFQVISLDRAGQVRGMAALMNKVLESRLQKVSGTQNCSFPRKALWVEIKNRGGNWSRR